MKLAVYKVVLTALIGLSITVHGVAQASGQHWDSLSTNQQKILNEFKGVWSELPEGKQQKLAKKADKLSSMPAEEAAKIKRHWAKKAKRYKTMTPEEWQQLKKRHERYKNLTPEQRKKAREGRKRFKALPPEVRKKLRRRWKEMNQDQRREMLDSLEKHSKH